MEKNKEKVRIISDCSSPESNSLNDLVINAHVKYDDISVAKELINRNDYMCKLDLQNAYRCVFIHPSEHKLLGMKWTFEGDSEPTYLIDMFCPFGAKKAPLLFQTLSKAVTRIAKNAGFHRICAYLDDYLIIENDKKKLH